MYQNNNHRFGNRGQQNNRFARPQGFSRGGGFRRVQKSMPNDASLFIKKASLEFVPEDYVTQNTFESFHLNPTLKSNIDKKGYTILTPIQDQAIQPILEGRDLIGLAATGTGKTAAFLIPLIQRMSQDRSKKTLIITPTRELAVQIQDEFRDFANNMQLFSALLIGGANMRRQINDLRRNPDLVVATPGRLKDLIRQRCLRLDTFSIIVLDEADLMVDIGFIADIKYFIGLLPSVRQSLFFSATISDKTQGILQAFVKNPITISVKKQEIPENIDQDVIRISNPSEKLDKLHDLLIKEEFTKVLIFGRTKHGIEKLTRELEIRGFKVGAIHGNKKQNQRQRVLESFKASEIQILLATDVASRGLDIPNVSHVINYELPEDYQDYIHRIGRTGRANKKGFALTFVQSFSNNYQTSKPDPTF